MKWNGPHFGRFVGSLFWGYDRLKMDILMKIGS